MSNTKKKDNQYSLPKGYWVVIICLALLLALSFGAAILWKSGWPDYLMSLQQCDGKPPVQANDWSGRYIVPGDDNYRIPGESGYSDYFCSEQEAESAGYQLRE